MSEVDTTLYHDPRCSKSRAALELLRARGVEPVLRDYQLDPPSADELRALLAALDLPAAAIVRVADADGLALPDGPAGDEAWIALLRAHPRLLQRPILRRGGRAVVARPPERVLELF